MCRTFGSMIVVLFPIYSFARGKDSLETMSYLTILDCHHGFWSMLKLFQFLARLNGPYKSDCVRRMVTSTKHRGLLVPLLTAKGGCFGNDFVGAKLAFLFGYRKGEVERKCQSSFYCSQFRNQISQLVPSRTVLTLSVQNGLARSKLALEKLGPIWSLRSIWLFSFLQCMLQPIGSEKRWL